VAIDPEKREIFILVGRAFNRGSLSADDEARLRKLLTNHNPSAPRLSLEDLVSAGKFATGVWLTFSPESLGLETIDPAAVA
jgi:hypothetical protein